MRPRGNRQPFRDPRREQPMINDRIRVPQVRVIDDENAQLGVMDTRAAIDLARERGFDLILVAAQATPPVCRIMDYGKFKYEQSKRVKIAHKKSASHELKMVRLHPRTSEHDRGILVRHADKFLREGHKVRVVCQFKGRENAYPQLGREQLDKVAADLAEISNVEGTINKQGREMAMMISPKPGLKPLPKAGKATEPTAEEAAFAAMQEQLAADAEAAEAQAIADGDAETDAPDDADADVVEGDTETVDASNVDIAPGESDDTPQANSTAV